MATFVRYLRDADGMSSARAAAADDLERGHSFLDSTGEAFAGLCGYRVLDAGTLPTNVDFQYTAYYAVYEGESLGRDMSSDGYLFTPIALVDVRHQHIRTNDEGEMDIYTDEEWAAVEAAV